MTDDELKIQLALGSIKWWELTKDQINAIQDVDTITLLYNLTCSEKLTDVFALLTAEVNMSTIWNRKVELTGNLT